MSSGCRCELIPYPVRVPAPKSGDSITDIVFCSKHGYVRPKQFLVEYDSQDEQQDIVLFREAVIKRLKRFEEENGKCS